MGDFHQPKLPKSRALGPPKITIPYVVHVLESPVHFAIAHVRMLCLLVSFCYAGVDAPQRQAFMQRFDLYMQRGRG